MVTLGQLRSLLQMADGDEFIPYGFHEPHSWRGIYAEVAFEPAANVPVKHMLADVERALVDSFEAYKGGSYTYHETTPVHLDLWGECRDYDLSPVITSIALAIAEAASNE